MKYVLAVSALLLSIGCNAEPMSEGEARFRICGACHGAQGEGGIGPALAGRDIAALLRSFKAGEGNAIMVSQASGLTPEQIEAIAAYVKTL